MSSARSALRPSVKGAPRRKPPATSPARKRRTTNSTNSDNSLPQQRIKAKECDMTTELNLRFPDEHHVIVRLGPDDDGSGQLPFSAPIASKELRDLAWYIETYGAHSLGDPDDDEAKRIAKQLPAWGQAL